jgi:hypothetical protein
LYSPYSHIIFINLRIYTLNYISKKLQLIKYVIY